MNLLSFAIEVRHNSRHGLTQVHKIQTTCLNVNIKERLSRKFDEKGSFDEHQCKYGDIFIHICFGILTISLSTKLK
ncbi:Uncharacterized protein TCM_002884 [Theobroma cacao]|uniref:Uncharacterized protein n=1 Tax=Theobroma cacao TaxID=3641 RepID=A0A061DV50_THECC|nr:Uncharacterized protein TCM_002884 [Theobroma cacao]